MFGLRRKDTAGASAPERSAPAPTLLAAASLTLLTAQPAFVNSGSIAPRPSKTISKAPIRGAAQGSSSDRPLFAPPVALNAGENNNGLYWAMFFSRMRCV